MAAPVLPSVLVQPFKRFAAFATLEADFLSLNPDTPLAVCVNTSLDLCYGIESHLEKKFRVSAQCPEHMRSLGNVVITSYPNRAPIYLLFTKNLTQHWPPVETLRQVFFQLKQLLSIKNPPTIAFPSWILQSGLLSIDPAVVCTLLEATFASSPTTLVVVNQEKFFPS